MKKARKAKAPKIHDFAKEVFTKGYISRAQERAKRRKSPWNLILIPLSLFFMAFFGYILFQLSWWVHTLFYPQHTGEMREVFRKGMDLSGLLLLFPNFIASVPFGLMAANLVAWCIPPARRTFEREAQGVKWASFAHAMQGLFKFGLWLLAICLVLSLIGAATHSTKLR